LTSRQNAKSPVNNNHQGTSHVGSQIPRDTSG
jgi:hypothetical protein